MVDDVLEQAHVLVGAAELHRLGQVDHLAHDCEAWLQLRDLTGQLRIGGVGVLEEIVGIGDRLRCTLQVSAEFVEQ